MKIVLVVVDSLRADHLGCYGYPQRTSPNIDNIAKQGLLFENAITQSNWTYPSVYSMISGRYPWVLQLNWVDQQINKSFITLPAFLSNIGYHTAIFSSFEFLINPRNFGAHFQEQRRFLLDDETIPFFRSWIRQHEDSFLFFHIGQYIHEPYYADEKYVRMFLDDDFEKKDIAASRTVKAITSKTLSASEPASHNLRKILQGINNRLIKLTRSELTYLLACYDAGIFYVQSILGEIHKIIKEESKDYLFILTADHGQAFWEHKTFGHSLGLYDELVKVPLIVDSSNKYKINISQQVELVDLYPTVLDVLGHEAEFKLDGRSLLSGLGDVGFSNNRMAISDGYPYLSIRSPRYKLITNYYRFLGYHEIYKKLMQKNKTKSFKRKMQALLSFDKLYNLEEDKAEKINLCRRERGIYKSLKAELANFMEISQKASLPPVEVNLDEEIIKKQLSDLGYL